MIFIKGARVLPITLDAQGNQQIWDRGAVLIGDDGKIAGVGPENEMQAPEGTEIVDASGKVITPGFIDAHTHVGIGEMGIGREGQDTNESTDPITPQVRAIDATYPHDTAFADALAAGITAVNVMPGSGNVIGGLAGVFKNPRPLIDPMGGRKP